MARAARKVRQATRRAKYGGKTFFGRMIKSGVGIAGGLLTGNPLGALQSVLTSQKVDEAGNTPADVIQRAEAVQQMTNSNNSAIKQMLQTPAAPTPAEQQERAAELQAQPSVGSQNAPAGDGKTPPVKKNNTIKFIAIGVGVLLVIVVLAKVLGGNKTK